MQFEQFYSATWRLLYRSMVLITASGADAEDVLQEAFAKAARDWAAVSRMENPEAWVRRVAVNAAMDRHRRSRRQAAAYGRLEVRPIGQDALSVDVMQALATLPFAERQVVVLHHLIGLGVDEIAHEVGRPSGTVKGQLVRGRQRLAQLLDLDLEVGTS